jgi:hypothetical protein
MLIYRFAFLLGVSSAALLAVSLVSLSASGESNAKPVLPSEPADQFVREVLTHEIEAQSQDHSLWCFHELKTEDGAQKLSRVCQTKEGQIERLVALNGHPFECQTGWRRRSSHSESAA